MSRPDVIEADVSFFGEDIPRDMSQHLLDTLSALGVHTSSPRPNVRSIELLLLLVILPLQAFLSSMGEDAYRALRQAIEDLFQASGAEGRKAAFQDRETELQVLLEPGLPEEAYEQLHSLDLSRFGSGTLSFNHGSKCWLWHPDAGATAGG
ncbi:hypothetical protein [Streptomyces olivaceoviridis]|uniref:hypothetical protein n=1 Tax=Streptomyces olivaceoviridis TaxID=1921 RepID=UPI0036970CC5